MLREMDPEMFFTWKAFFTSNPWGERRDDLRAGTIAALIANVNRDSKKAPKPFTPEDFFPLLSKSKATRRGSRRPMMAEEWNAAKKQFKFHYGG